jgi:hypothetical protein
VHLDFRIIWLWVINVVLEYFYIDTVLVIRNSESDMYKFVFCQQRGVENVILPIGTPALVTTDSYPFPYDIYYTNVWHVAKSTYLQIAE